MGQARNPKHLTQIGGELNLGTAQHKGCQQSAALLGAALQALRMLMEVRRKESGGAEASERLLRLLQGLVRAKEAAPPVALGAILVLCELREAASGGPSAARLEEPLAVQGVSRLFDLLGELPDRTEEVAGTLLRMYGWCGAERARVRGGRSARAHFAPGPHAYRDL